MNQHAVRIIECNFFVKKAKLSDIQDIQPDIQETSKIQFKKRNSSDSMCSLGTETENNQTTQNLKI